MRSILYAYYYIWAAGISAEPWNDKRFFVMASGDDTVIFCEPSLEIPIKEAILNLTTRNNLQQDVGLG